MIEHNPVLRERGIDAPCTCFTNDTFYFAMTEHKPVLRERGIHAPCTCFTNDNYLFI
jgi:hypothetical protein